jgi:hypothetical protein
MGNAIMHIELRNLAPHPANPNRMSKVNFARLVRHIERTGRYEPLIVRPLPQPSAEHRASSIENQASKFQIINGHHRFEALKQLGYEACDCVIWDIDDDEALLLLATLNRLCGQDELGAKCALLDRLNSKLKVDELARLLPQTKTQIKRLIDLHKEKLKIELAEPSQQSFAHPLVFFLSAEQKAVVENAIQLASSTDHQASSSRNRASRNARAITQIARHFISSHEQPNAEES